MSSLFVDTDIWLVKITLYNKSGSGSTAYSFTRDWHNSNALYSGSPETYPLLAEDPLTGGEIGRYSGVRRDTTILLHGKSDMTAKGQSFMDLLELADFQHSDVWIYYYPKSKDAAISSVDAKTLRGKLKGFDKSYDEATGIVSLIARDVWFKDKEISKPLKAANFYSLDPKWESEYGAIVFGQSTTSGEGVTIDAPYIQRDNTSIPAFAQFFAGWNFGSHSTKAFDRVLLRNQNRERNPDAWVAMDSSSTDYGDTVSSPVADPANWPRDLSRYERGIVYTPSAGAKLLTCVIAKLQNNQNARYADIADGQHFYNNSNPDFLSAGDVDFTFKCTLIADTAHTASNRVIAAQGDSASATLEWQLYFNTADDKLTFGISVDGSTIAVSVKWGTALTTGVEYDVVVQHDSAGNQLGIFVNAGTVVTQATGASVMTRRNGPFHIGSNVSTIPGFDGKMFAVGYWSRLITGVGFEVTTLYNSGQSLLFSELSDTMRDRLRCFWDMGEPYGMREDASGSADLMPATNNNAVSPQIPYSTGARTVTLATSKGDLSVEIYHAETRDSGVSYAPIGGAIRKFSIDLTYAPLTGSGSDCFFIPDPVVLAPNVVYLIQLSFSNDTTNVYFVRCWYDSNAGSVHYAIDKRRDDQNWSKQTDVRLDLRLGFASHSSSPATNTVDGTNYYTYSQLNAKAVNAFWDSGNQKYLTNDVDLKLGVKGLADDGSGTYTGVASAVIENPSDIIRFGLMHATFGLGLTSSDVNTTALSSVRSSLSALGITHKIVIDRETFLEEFILEIARQSRTIFYKERQGKLSLKFPTTARAAIDYTLTEADMRGDFILDSVTDNDYSEVINACVQYYKPDTLNLPDDPAVIRRDVREKLSGKLELSSATSTAGDTFRKAQALASETLYGRREMSESLDHFDSASIAQIVQNYNFDRYNVPQTRFRFRIPMRDWYNVADFFTNIRAIHTGISEADGTSIEGSAHTTGTGLTVYDEGIPGFVWSGGTLEGQALVFEEQGAWMSIVCETTAVF